MVDNSESFIILVPTLECTQKCLHCNQDHPVGIMPESVYLPLLLELANNTNRKYRFYFIGGEPLLAKREWYSTFHSHANFLGLNYTTKLQTSLIGFSIDWIEYFKNNLNSIIYTSFDPYSRTIDNSTEKYIQTINATLKILKQHQIRSCAQLTVSPEILRNRDNLFDILTTSQFDIISFCHYSSTDDSVAVLNSEYSELLCDIFDKTMHNYQNNLSYPKLSTLADAIKSVVSNSAYGAWEEVKCTRLHSYAVYPNGSVNTCHIYPKQLGNSCSSLQELYDSAEALKCRALVAKRKYHDCEKCMFNSWCSPRCYRDPYHVSFKDKDFDCQRYSKFLTHIQSFCMQPNNYTAALLYSTEVVEHLANGRD